ncbi:C-C motif chemokine 27a isoform X2 [Clarias gariepinus]|uniref:C-C motif chemokine 27a isoform X2 n=1 Tax=Clarias gariepinus TaxID=13013 RepID=UPI00234D6E87|nr:C-C motif chemokine 27a isoform X2 [Clarias gariepinus]
MELRTVAMLLFLLCAIIITKTEGRIPNCCLKTSNKVKLETIKISKKYYIQSDAGPCEIKALVLEVKNRKYCLHPQTESKVKKLMKKKLRHANKQKKQ